MQLLVSVADAGEAPAARLGGADVNDAKNPRRGALGAVSEATLRAIGAAAGRPFSAALGDAGGLAILARRSRVAAQLGASYVRSEERRVGKEGRSRWVAHPRRKSDDSRDTHGTWSAAAPRRHRSQ